MTEESVILEIGVGNNKKMSGSLGVDVRKTLNVDVISDARHLPFKTSSIDILYSAHTIEHFSHRETESVIHEWNRVLKPEGSIEIRCPDLRIRAFLFLINPADDNIKNIYGGQEYPENFHKSGFSYGLLKKILKKCGFTQIRRIFDGYKGIPWIPSDLHVLGKKKEEKHGSGKKS